MFSLVTRASFNGWGMGWHGIGRHGSDDMGMKSACGMGYQLGSKCERSYGAWYGTVGKLGTGSAGRHTWNFSSKSLRPKGRNGKADALFNFVYYATDNCTHL